MAAWLVKTEPGTYGYDDLEREGRAVWDGVANPVAVKNLGAMAVGDRVFVYHTGGEKQVKAEGSTLQEVITDLEANHPGIKDRLVTDGALHRFVNVYVNDEDVRFLGGLEAELSDGDQVVVLPAVAGG